MRQLFFISPTGFPAVRQAFTPPIIGARTHGWVDEGSDPHTQQIVGVVEMAGNVDAEAVIDRLEANGIMWLPNHKDNQKIHPAHAAALAKHGVAATHTTTEAMNTLFTKSGFPPHKPKRF